MQPEILTAIIAAIVSVLATLTTLFIGLRSLRNEREKIRIEADRLQLENEKLINEKEKAQADLRESARQARVWQEDIERLRAETKKLLLETDEIHIKRLKGDRDEIKDFLVSFNRAVFDAPMRSEDPVKMYKALRETRISLQTSGANLIRDDIVASSFAEIRKILITTEAEVLQKYPVIVELANEKDDERASKDGHYFDYEKRRKAQEKLQEYSWDAVRLMMNIRPQVDRCLSNIQGRLHELDRQLEALVSSFGS